MADGFFPTLVSKDENANALANPLFVQVTDGTDGLLVNGDGSLNVVVTGGAANSQFAEDSAHVSGDIGTEMLAVRRDTPASGVSADGDYATLNVDSSGRLWTNVNNTVTVSATDLDIRDLAFATDKVDVTGSSVTVSATDLDIRNLVFATDKVDVSGSSVTVSATDLDIRDLTLASDAVRVSANTSANSATNPIYVAPATVATTGEVHDYNTATVGGGSTSNHSYTVTNTMYLKGVEFACSGGGKVELLVGPVASLVSKWVGFVPKEGGVIHLKLDPAIEVPNTSTGTVRLVRTNREGASQDLYSTIIGIDA